MKKEVAVKTSSKNKDVTNLAPQPGATNNKEADSVDTALMVILSFGKLFSNVFKLNIMSYCFWMVMMYFIGATILIIAFSNLSPTIGRVSACPSKSNGYLLAILWYIMALANIITAYGYNSYEASDITAFQNLTLYAQVVGFLIKVVPVYTRLLHVISLCQLNVMSIQILFLPECNSKSLVSAFGLVFMIWWAILAFGVWCKHSIFIPPYLYSPMRPGRTFFNEIEKMMSAFGP